MKPSRLSRILIAATLCLAAENSSLNGAEPKIGEKLVRAGDEIVVCGQLYHTTAPVVLWMDPGGYDAYRLERKFAPPEDAMRPLAASPDKPLVSRYATRKRGLSEAELAQVRERGWDLPLLQKSVDQFVLHFDARGTSRRCFDILHNLRGLSVHFMLDLDGTIYQTLDLKEAAWHATIANGRSIGIEIANIGAFPADKPSPLEQWYQADPDGQVRLTIPDIQGKDAIRRKDLVLRPARNQQVIGEIQQQRLKQFDYTPQQYESLAKLTATLCALFPAIRCDYPREADGALVRVKLPDSRLAEYRGILGHFHVQTNRVDPGPAFQWDRLISEAKSLRAP